MRRIPSATARCVWIAAGLLLLPGTRAAATCVSITCPANTTAANDLNQCGGVRTYPAPTPNVVGGAPTCGTISCSPASGSFFPRGSTTVTCMAAAGNTCTFTVTINDTQPPQISAPAEPTVVGTTPGAPIVVNYPAPTASDNCPGIEVPACDPPSGSNFPSGDSSVDCSVGDAVGNTASTAFEVHYFDACVQDDVSDEFLRWSTADGAYELVDCDASVCSATGFERTGTGEATPTASGFKLAHKLDDRSLKASLGLGSGKGSARVTLRDGNTRLSLKLKDASFANDACACP